MQKSPRSVCKEKALSSSRLSPHSCALKRPVRVELSIMMRKTRKIMPNLGLAPRDLLKEGGAQIPPHCSLFPYYFFQTGSSFFAGLLGRQMCRSLCDGACDHKGGQASKRVLRSGCIWAPVLPLLLTVCWWILPMPRRSR